LTLLPHYNTIIKSTFFHLTSNFFNLVKRVVANASISIKDFIFKFDDGDGRVLTATLNSLDIFSADPRNKWSVSNFFEPEGPQKRVCKAATARGLSIRLDRLKHKKSDTQQQQQQQQQVSKVMQEQSSCNYR